MPHAYKKRRPWSLLLKIMIWAGVFFAVIFTVMAFLGGSSETLKGAIEEYITETTGYEAHIEKLNRMTFFPRVGFDFEGLAMNKIGQEGDPVITADKVAFFVDFLDATFATGRFRTLSLEKASINSGILLGRPVYIESLNILHERDQNPVLKLKGFIDDSPLEAQMSLSPFGRYEKPEYEFSKRRTFFIRMGAAEANGIMFYDDDDMVLEKVSLFMDGKEFASAEARVSDISREETTFTGLLEMARNSQITADIHYTAHGPDRSLEGAIGGSSVDLENFAKDAAAGKFIAHLYDVFLKQGETEGSYPLQFRNVDLAFSFDLLRQRQEDENNEEEFRKHIMLQNSVVYMTVPGEIYAADFTAVPQ